MAFTNTINPAVPAANAMAGLGDDELRQLKLDITERLASFFADPNADPLVPLSGALTRMRAANYDAAAAAGSRATNLAVARALFIKATGVADAAGLFAIDLDEAGFTGGGYSVTNLVMALANDRTNLGKTQFRSTDPATNTATFDTFAASTAFTVDILMVFSA